ncbi:MAG: hypothetical protein ACREUM_04470, partial [Nitrosospira sp.]
CKDALVQNIKRASYFALDGTRVEITISGRSRSGCANLNLENVPYKSEILRLFSNLIRQTMRKKH